MVNGRGGVRRLVSGVRVSGVKVSECQSIRVSSKMNYMEKGYKKLNVWVESHRLAVMIYRATEIFPKTEIYGLTSQIRRSALSAPTNIVEGQSSVSKKEFLRFLDIANKSLTETDYLMEFALELKYFLPEEYDRLEGQRIKVGRMLNALMRSVRSKL